MLRRTLAVAGPALLLALAGCSSDEPESSPVATNMTDALEANAAAEASVINAIPEPLPSPTDVAPTPDPVAPETDTTQVQDDADATGMTARVDRGDAAADAGAANQSQPAEAREQK